MAGSLQLWCVCLKKTEAGPVSQRNTRQLRVTWPYFHACNSTPGFPQQNIAVPPPPSNILSPWPTSQLRPGFSSVAPPSLLLRHIEISHPFPHETGASVPQEFLSEVDRVSREWDKPCRFVGIKQTREREGAEGSKTNRVLCCRDAI